MEKALENLSKQELLALLKASQTEAENYKQSSQEYKTKLEASEHLVTQLKRLIFGSKRERFIAKNNPHQQELPFDQWKHDSHKLEQPSLPKEVKASLKTKKTHRQKGAKGLPTHLPVNEIYLQPKGIDLVQYTKIGEEITEKLEIIPAKLFINRYIRPKYILKSKLENQNEKTEVIIADLPSFCIEKSFASNSLLSQLMVDKFVDHLPFYRQINRYKREGVEISDTTISRWQASIGHLLEPLYLAMKKTILEQGYIQADESTIPVLDKSKKGKSHTGYHWVYYSPLEKMVLFDYRPSRSKVGPKQMLQYFKGYLQTDGYAGYDQFFGQDKITTIACWAHARRYFEKALDNDKSRAELVMGQIQNLYQIERFCKENELSSKQRYEYRLKHAQPILEYLVKYLIREKQQVLPQSPIGKAINYTLKRWVHLMNYLMDGQLEIDNNLVEGTIRSLAIGRKNYLFAGSHDAAKVQAMFYTFFGTCKKHNVNPNLWLKKVLDIIPEYNIQKLQELFPQNLNLEE